MENLHKCPFCKTDEQLIITTSDLDYMCWVHCNQCKMDGPYGDSVKDAINKFNNWDSKK